MVTHRLNLQPTGAFEAGTPVSRRSSATRDSSLWMLKSSPSIQSGTELAVQLHRLLVVLEPVTQSLWDLIHTGYQANWFCYIASHATEHAAELDRQLLERLLALPGDLWLDASGDDTDDEDIRRAGSKQALSLIFNVILSVGDPRLIKATALG